MTIPVGATPFDGRHALRASTRFESGELPALAAMELDSIAQGTWTLDAILKESPVEALFGQGLSGGHYLIIFAGQVEECARSLGRAIDEAGPGLRDEVLLPGLHPDLRQRLTGAPCAMTLGAVTLDAVTLDAVTLNSDDLPAVGLIETRTAPALLGAVDTALKTGETALLDLHLLVGIGGKSTGTLLGDVESVRVAIEAAAEVARERDRLIREVVIPRPDPHLLRFLQSHPR